MNIKIIKADDWIEVVKDGEGVWRNHSCPGTKMLDALGINYTSVYLEEGSETDIIDLIDLEVTQAIKETELVIGNVTFKGNCPGLFNGQLVYVGDFVTQEDQLAHFNRGQDSLSKIDEDLGYY